MSFEVYPVGPPKSSSEQDVQAASDEIKAIYTLVAREGGRIIAQHELAANDDRSDITSHKRWLFLVADFPVPLQNYHYSISNE